MGRVRLESPCEGIRSEVEMQCDVVVGVRSLAVWSVELSALFYSYVFLSARRDFRRSELSSDHFYGQPGLTGGSDDSYVQHFAQRARSKGWAVVVFNARGCAEAPVTTPQVLFSWNLSFVFWYTRFHCHCGGELC